MKLEFTKMQGAGNDYIYINCLDKELEFPEKLSAILSDRHFGIGGDGIVLICKSDVADAKMRMFNADGSEGKMCGNAIRCVAKYLYDKKLVKQHSEKGGKEITIETLSGIKYLELNTQNGQVCRVKVNMGKAELDPQKIPVKLHSESGKIVNYPIDVDGEQYRITCVSMGNPHAVVFYDTIEKLNLPVLGPKFENNSIFPDKVNTEFIKVTGKNTLKMRVWERGSGETLACGTGACAAVVAAVENGYCNKNEEIKVILLGGELMINYTDEAVYMTGPCVKVFDGVMQL